MSSSPRYAESDLPTPWGTFRLVVYRLGEDEALALVFGDVAGGEDVLVRVHSECLTGEVFGSLRCDCRQQLDLALQRIAEVGRGAVVYLRQEGRGIGLGNKIRAYALQDQGRDTVEANLALGFEADPRTYEEASEILRDLGISSIRLLTNNPAKIEGLRQSGVEVRGQEAHWVASSEHNRDYLEVKKAKLGHIVHTGSADDPPQPVAVEPPVKKATSS